jgi:hypothetical protein
MAEAMPFQSHKFLSKLRSHVPFKTAAFQQAVKPRPFKTDL